MAFSVNGGGSGSRRGGRGGAPLADINVTPFVDVVLVLLIIFMLTAHVMEYGLQVDVPKTQYVRESAPDLPVVSITKDGTTFVNDKPTNIQGRIYFLQRRYDDALQQFNATIAIDPEDLEANYNLMLTYTGLGKPETAAEFQKRYLRFKADEASQALVGPYVRTHPDDNNERQPIHEHVSETFLTAKRRAPAVGAAPKYAVLPPHAKESD